MSEMSLNLTLLSIRADNKFILICQHLWHVKRLEGISKKDKNGALNSLMLLWKSINSRLSDLIISYLFEYIFNLFY